MLQRLEFTEQGIFLCIEITGQGDTRLLHCAATPLVETTLPDESAQHRFRLVELQVTGENRDEHHDVKHSGTHPGNRLRYVRHVIEKDALGSRLIIEQRDDATGLVVHSHMQLFSGIPVLRSWTTVTNDGASPVGLEYVSSFALTGLTKDSPLSWEQSARLHVPYNTWCGELQWRTHTLPELGLTHVMRTSMPDRSSVKRISYQSLGTWSAAQYLPMGAVENYETGDLIAWQIEHLGSWQWEVSDSGEYLTLRLSGPTDQEHQWWKYLLPGETFTSVPVAVAVAHRHSDAPRSAFELAVTALTHYRRSIRRPHMDNVRLPVIFNDYMNCLGAEPTTEKEIPLIQAAAKAGCEIFCIDAGWYAELGSTWWETVGAWEPSLDRFAASGGLVGLLDEIRRHGMVPGLWLELEVMGIHSPLAQQLPDACFFCRHGKRVIDEGRYQLDFRHSLVHAHADAVVDRLVREYGVGYIKMDYNINAGVGTDVDADSPGEGLLAHNRAYLAWLDEVFTRYPDLIIENCSSGGMRMDYALLARHSIQSISDQEDYRRTSLIAAAAPTAVTPEQGAIWAYPLAHAEREAIITNMVNALLGRIHLSGKLADQTEEGQALIYEAVTLYKDTLQAIIPQSEPIWPLGLPGYLAPWTSLGLIANQTLYLSVWRLDSEQETCELSLIQYTGHALTVSCLYPREEMVQWRWEPERGMLIVGLPVRHSARLLKIIETFGGE